MPQTVLKLQKHQIPSAETAKFFGITLDCKLDWKAHGAVAMTKGQDWMIQFTQLAKMSQGTSA